jgi:release factor glutamine methyltransferase
VASPAAAEEPARVWSVLELLRWTTTYLADRGLENARLNAELLLAGALRLKRLDLYLQYDRPLAAEELAEFKQRLKRRALREPLQYIDGVAAFRELLLKVDRRVLIPRPETEVLVEAVLGWARGREALHAVDVGTGSGAIALALATEGPFARVVAVDVQEDALALARENHAAAAPDSPVEFRPGDLLAPVRGERFDVVVSNPPYVRDDERTGLEPEVRDWEPARALFAGPDGLEVVRRLATDAPAVLRPGGLLALEVGAGQPAAVAALLRESGRWAEPRVLRDLAGRDRIVMAELNTQGESWS